MGGFPPNGPSKIQTFYPFKLIHEIFKVSKYKAKIKFGGTEMGGPPQTGPKKFKLFNHL